MKNSAIVQINEQARIYRNHYKPHFNLFRFLRSILIVLISGQGAAARFDIRRK